MLTREEADRRVANGVALLSDAIPGWWSKINLSLLNIEACRTCILGQMYGLYEDGVSILHLNWETSIKHGFGLAGDPGNDGIGSSWHTLETAWIAAILRLRSPVELPAVRSEVPATEYAIAK